MFRTKRFAWLTWVLIAVTSYFAASYAFAALVVLFGQREYFSTTVGVLIAHVVLLIGIFLFMAAGYYLAARRRFTRLDAGIPRQMSWHDIGIGLAGFALYFLLSAIVLTIARTVPGFDITEAQNVGVTTLFGAERLVGFIVLVIVTPFFEELLFRGILFSKIRASGLGLWPTATIVSVLFAVAHGQWNVGLDVFCLSMVAAYLRESTGAIWAGMLIHVIKNMIAFYFMFVILHGIGS